MRDVSRYIGKPFKYGGRGPDCYDCYGLVLELLKEDGVIVPDYYSPNTGPEIVAMVHNKIEEWKQCATTPGSVLVFRLPGYLHVGYFLGENYFIHAWEGSSGVVVERLDFWRRRLLGAYRYAG